MPTACKSAPAPAWSGAENSTSIHCLVSDILNSSSTGLEIFFYTLGELSDSFEIPPPVRIVLFFLPPFILSIVFLASSNVSITFNLSQHKFITPSGVDAENTPNQQSTPSCHTAHILQIKGRTFKIFGFLTVANDLVFATSAHYRGKPIAGVSLTRTLFAISPQCFQIEFMFFS